jgi:hypothetical protein
MTKTNELLYFSLLQRQEKAIRNKWGYINAEGKQVVECKFDYAYSFSGGLAMVKLNGKYSDYDMDSHSSITSYYGINDDNVWKFEFTPKDWNNPDYKLDVDIIYDSGLPKDDISTSMLNKIERFLQSQEFKQIREFQVVYK